MKTAAFLVLNKLMMALSPGGQVLRELPGVKTLYEAMYWRLRPKETILIACQGNRMYVDARDVGLVPHLLANGVYERYQTELFKQRIRSGMIVIDIGANFGYYTLLAARLLRGTGRVIAFEPDPRNFELLLNNVRINGYANVVAIRRAVSNKNGKLKLFLDGLNLGMHSLSEKNVSRKAGFVEVDALCLDDYLESVLSVQKVDLMKIDVEGAEGLVIGGAAGTLRHVDRIFIAFWPRGLRNLGTSPLGLVRMLRHHGFTIGIVDETQGCIRELEGTELARMIESKHDLASNLLLERREHGGRMERRTIPSVDC
jgi:FkbM family methyltransferase